MSEHPLFSRELTWQERAERAEARVAELEAENAALKEQVATLLDISKQKPTGPGQAFR